MKGQFSGYDGFGLQRDSSHASFAHAQQQQTRTTYESASSILVQSQTALYYT